jgi:hypothetical protein
VHPEIPLNIRHRDFQSKLNCKCTIYECIGLSAAALLMHKLGQVSQTDCNQPVARVRTI